MNHRALMLTEYHNYLITTAIQVGTNATPHRAPHILQSLLGFSTTRAKFRWRLTRRLLSMSRNQRTRGWRHVTLWPWLLTGLQGGCREALCSACRHAGTLQRATRHSLARCVSSETRRSALSLVDVNSLARRVETASCLSSQALLRAVGVR